MDVTELCYAPATQLAAAIRAKEISPVEVTEAVLARIERLNPRLNAYCTLTPELARTTARAAEAAVMRGDALGPLHGVPYSLKDLTPTKGIRTTFGSKIFVRLSWKTSASRACGSPGRPTWQVWCL